MRTDFISSTKPVDAGIFTIIESRGLIRRLADEAVTAWRDLLHDPLGFIRAAFTSETADRRRQRRVRIAVTCAAGFHAVLLSIIIIAGIRHVSGDSTEQSAGVHWVRPEDFNRVAGPRTPAGNPPNGGQTGGGGSGSESPQPATQGNPPPMLPVAPIVKPTGPAFPNPVLPTPATIQGPETVPPLPNATTGIPDGKIGEPPSPGTGSGGGLGDGSGQGTGAGKGAGAGPGKGAGSGGGQFGSPDGTLQPAAEIPFSLAPRQVGYVPFTWTYRPTPVVTPEAQASKVFGTVLLRATFLADGRITDVEVVNPVPFWTESAIDALRRSRFRPATVDGRPVTLTRVLVRIEVRAQ